MLAPNPSTILERILVIGGPGTGKSTAYLSIASLAQLLRSPAQFHVLDTDDATERMLATEYPHLTNVHVYPTYEWSDYPDNLARAAAACQRHDWLVIDQIDTAWEVVQEDFILQTYGKDSSAFFADHRRRLEEERSKNAKAKMGGLDGWKDWGVINRTYKSFIRPLVYRQPCHVLCCAKSAPLSDEDDRDIRLAAGNARVKPQGQKHLLHQFHTCLSLDHLRADEWRLTTVKDRGRRRLTSEPLNNFAKFYLKEVAGWNATPHRAQ